VKITVYIQEYQEFSKVTYYTLRLYGEMLCETDKFVNRFNSPNKYYKELQLITSALKIIGDIKGASDSNNFRPEKKAQALPSKSVGCDLRLYCFVVNPYIVILGNGGVKDKRFAQDGKDTKEHFHLMNKIAAELEKTDLKKLKSLIWDIKLK